MNKKNYFSILIFSIISIFMFGINSFASVIYKDISSISIRTNFNFDYDSIRDEGVPEINVGDASEGQSSDYNIYTSSTKYYIESAEWYDNDIEEFGVGGQPKIICYLVTKDYPNESSTNDYYYRFMSSYGTSSCFIGSGTLVSAQRVSTDNLKVIFKLRNLKGTYNQPEEAYWGDSFGLAMWTSPNINDSGYYDIQLFRDDKSVAHITKYKGNQYDFYSYMTKAGEYTFKVRTVGGTDVNATYGKSSEYIDSSNLTVEENQVYDPSKGVYNNYNINTNPSATNPMQVGWIKKDNNWIFIRPDGQIVKNGWIEWDGKWYYLDQDGIMKTGWLESNGNEYFLSTDGSMMTGWLSNNSTFFFFDTTQGNHYGAMCKNMFIQYQNKYFYFDDSGIMCTGWRQIREDNGNTAFYYFYQNGEVEGLYGYMATNTTINGFKIGSDGKWIQSSR